MAASLFYFQGHQHGLKAIILGPSQEEGNIPWPAVMSVMAIKRRP